MIILSNVLRYFLTYLSFPSNLYKEKLNNHQIKLIHEIKNITQKKNIYKKQKLLTHKIFSNSLLNIIKKGQLSNFLRIGFIQKMFFVHNRIYNVKFLRNILKSKSSTWISLLKENSIGNPVPFFLYKKTSGNRIRHVYLMKKIFEYADIKKVDAVIEIGGGYGCMGSIFYKLNKNIDYTIYDLPEVNLLQSYYFKSLKIKCDLNEINKKISLLSDLSILKKKINILKKKNNKILIIANWSFSEMPLTLRKKMQYFFSNSDFILISFQQYFENISNLNYFKKLKVGLNKTHLSNILEISEMNNKFIKNKHFILLGKNNAKNNTKK